MSDVTTTDPWQMIFDKAGDLADSLLHEQPKSEFDAVDFEEKVVSVLKKIAYGEVNPREDWSVIIRPVNKKSKLDEEIEKHFEIALRQAVFVRVIFEYDMQKIRANFPEVSQRSMLLRSGEEMLDALSCAQQHATAWRLLKEVRDKSFEARSRNASRVKDEIKEEKKVMLRSMIEPSIERLRPPGGWLTPVLASQDIAKYIVDIFDNLPLSFSMGKDEMSQEIHRLIVKDSRFRKAYETNAKEPIVDPVKMRRVIVKFGYNDQE
ncbi:hypothetical protein KG088_08725 [Halomonas sp. TRM85114]|uniref:hypothetical protein n=1 Tax=Halomonas jincaotanensis TaxID=2810616 RepID=UPI001BD6DC6D|nr:hypothetical protein [Halomonas jincaotanensis]MBS9403712.1 hypothetical protein [Halomonas jincaotanensis]